MILDILQRVVRYRLLANSVTAYRYMGYFYFIPLIMMPSLLLITAIHLKYGEKLIISRAELIVKAHGTRDASYLARALSVTVFLSRS